MRDLCLLCENDLFIDMLCDYVCAYYVKMTYLLICYVIMCLSTWFGANFSAIAFYWLSGLVLDGCEWKMMSM